MCIYCDYCVYHYKSTELVSLYTLDIGLKINIIITLKKYYYYNSYFMILLYIYTLSIILHDKLGGCIFYHILDVLIVYFTS